LPASLRREPQEGSCPTASGSRGRSGPPASAGASRDRPMRGAARGLRLCRALPPVAPASAGWSVGPGAVLTSVRIGPPRQASVWRPVASGLPCARVRSGAGHVILHIALRRGAMEAGWGRRRGCTTISKDLEGERSPGRIGRLGAGNGAGSLRTRLWSKASEARFTGDGGPTSGGQRLR